VFHISGKDDFLVDVETAEEIELAIRGAEPGPYRIDEMSAKPLPNGCTSQKWGTAIRRGDGSVVTVHAQDAR
jgi:hypothetical protein